MRRRGARRRAAGGFLSSLAVASLALLSAIAHAKTFAVRSPSGREIYRPGETFGETLDHARRAVVLEVALGAGPQGNLGLLVGWLPKAIKGWELYGGVGIEANPATHYTVSVRRLFNIRGYRPFASVGYLLRRQLGIGTDGHNVYSEIGYSWALEDTYHLTIGVGMRYLADVRIRDGSLLRGPDIDPAFLERELDDLDRWVPIVAVRFSRAF